MRSRALLAILGVTLLAALMTRVPLARLPSYEAGVAVGLAAALACCWLAAGMGRRRPEPSLRWGLLAESPGEQVLREARAAFGAGLVMVGLPIVLLASEAARTGCRVMPGVPTYLLVAVPAAFAGTALGVLAASIARRRLAIVGITALVVTADVAWGLAHVVIGPRHVVHDFFLGPLSSAAYTGYDGALELPDSVAVHRLFAIILWIAVLAAAAWIRARRDGRRLDAAEVSPHDNTAVASPGDSTAGASPRDSTAGASPGESAAGASPAGDDAGWARATADDAERVRFLLRWHARGGRRATFLAGIALVPFLLVPDHAGLTPGRARLERTLSAAHETEHFVLRHAPGSLAPPELERLAVEHEAAWRQVTRWLEIDPDWKVTAWLHPDARTLFELTGARGYVFAAPWNREFHVHSAGSGRIRNLRHELVHVLAAEFGAFPFGASLAPGLIEGLATALDEGYARLPEAHEELAAAARVGHVPDPAALMSLRGFAAGNMDRAYRSSASFVGWLLWRHGPEPLREAYRTADFGAAYGESVEELAAEWRTFLDGIEPPPALAARAERRFDPALRPAFHELPCPRVGRDEMPRPSIAARAFGRFGHHEVAAGLHCEAWHRSGDPRELAAAARQLLAADAPSRDIHEARASPLDARQARASPLDARQARASPLDARQARASPLDAPQARASPLDAPPLGTADGVPPGRRPGRSPGRRVEALLLLEEAIGSGRLPADELDTALSTRTAILGSLGRFEAARRSHAERREAGLAEWPEELEIVAQALDTRPEIAQAHFAARLETGAAAREAHAQTLGRAPGFAPALHRLLEASRFRSDRLAGHALAFADAAPEAPELAARHLLVGAQGALSEGDWATAALLHARVLEIPRARPLQHLAAEEGLELAQLGLQSRHRLSGPAQPLPPACRNLP